MAASMVGKRPAVTKACRAFSCSRVSISVIVMQRSYHKSRWNFIRSPLPLHPLQLPDHPLDHAQAPLPELGIARVEAEGLKQFGMMLGAAGREHREIALGKTFVRLLVDRVERVHQAVAERVGVNVERRMDEMRDVHPEILVSRADVDGRSEALAL